MRGAERGTEGVEIEGKQREEGDESRGEQRWSIGAERGQNKELESEEAKGAVRNRGIVMVLV
jgi:hypothetical protein